LVRRGVDVFAVSRQSEPVPRATKTVSIDLFDHAAVRHALAEIKPDALLHLAWVVDPNRFWTAPENADWSDATLQLARSALETGTGRIVGVGTCFEYAWPDDGNCDEKITPIIPTTPYAIAKNAARQALANLCARESISFAWARLFFPYGPFEHQSRLVPSLAINLARRVRAPLSSGSQIRDYIDVRDAGDALAALTLSDVTGEVNIASGQPVTLAEIADCLGRIAGRPDLIARGALPDRPNEPRRIVAATARLTGEVGVAVPRPLEQGLAEAYEWWRLRTENNE
jgi:nucleoside-diphosphate-sugar epimerase